MGVKILENSKLLWALIKNVIDPEWDQIPSRIPKIDEKNFEEIAELMEQNILIV